MRPILLILLFAQVAIADVTPSQWLAAQTGPQFKAGHGLPRLTKFWSYQLPSEETFNLRVQMATNWGYAMDFNCPNHNLIDLATDMADTNSIPYRAIQLSKNYSNSFPLQISVDRFWAYSTPWPSGLTLSDGFWCTNASGDFVDNSTNSWSTFPSATYDEIVSPEAPDSDWQAVAEWTANPLARIASSNGAIAVILNGGEYGLNAPKSTLNAWQADPRVTNAVGSLSWPEYSSLRASNQFGIVSAAVRAAVPSRQLYLYYGTGTEINKITAFPDWFNDYCNGFWSQYFAPVSDAPVFEHYFPYKDTWLKPVGAYEYDYLTKHLNVAGYYLEELNTKTNYNFVSGGFWTQTNHYSEISTFTGFLKCLYTSGMVGATIYLEDDGYFNDTFAEANPPHWLRQIEAVSRVHAQFTYLEDYIWNGELLAGSSPHVMSTDQAAYEFTNTLASATSRVLARKHNDRNEWLVCAWAADGTNQDVTVTIPTLGTITVTAADSGNLYSAIPGRVSLLNSLGRRVDAKEMIVQGSMTINR